MRSTQHVSGLPDGPLDITWLAADTPRLPQGRVRLHWEPASHTGWDVTAHLGLATTEVHLASWPAAPDDWPHLVRPTLLRGARPLRRPRGRDRRPRPLESPRPRLTEPQKAAPRRSGRGGLAVRPAPLRTHSREL
ncbi:hypothetical protein LUR56_04520 [Streptomyces sp. MT29]|nr:hypothetical protein [Streptomyces sp. MT29]